MLNLLAKHHDWVKDLYWFRPDRRITSRVLDTYCVILARIYKKYASR